MNDLVAHRGPDGEGFYHGPNFAFGHRRLSIIDLSQNGHQPMAYGQNLVITFNGEIYNYLELRVELLAAGYSFQSDSDTEVILAAYAHWGDSCVTRFNGMWAFAIYDSQKKRLFCSRDRFGVKPFYYTKSSNQFAFGSEIKQLLPFLQNRKMNQQIVLDYLIAGIEEFDEHTFFEGVYKLPPSYNLIYDLTDHSIDLKRYFEINFDERLAKLDESAAVETYRNAFEDSVKLRLRSDVKVGTCLSGGMDSSSVAAVASDLYMKSSGQAFIAIHAQSSEQATDESDKAKLVAEHCKLNLQIVQPSSEDFKVLIDEVIYTQEEPFGSPSVFMQYMVLKKARELKCLVMLDGQGGDETLLGYEKYYPAYINSLSSPWQKFRGFMKSAENSSLSRWQVLQYFIYFTKYQVRLRRIKRRAGFIKAPILEAYQSKQLKALSASYLNIKKLQLLEVTSLQLPHLLKYEDKNSMRNSVETRLPFLDFRVLQTALSLNSSVKIRNGWTKYVLRKSMEKRLPDAIVWRKNKFGFNAPEKTWLHEIEDEMKQDIANSDLLKCLIDFSKLNIDTLDLRTKWRLFNLARWQKLYDVKTS